MHRISRRMVAVVVLIGAIAAGGAAFTASNTFTTGDVAGYGSVSVTGATVSAIHNVVDTSGNVTEVDLTFASALGAGSNVQAGFNDELGQDTCAGSGVNWTCPVTNGTGPGSTETLSSTSSGYSVTVTQ